MSVRVCGRGCAYAQLISDSSAFIQTLEFLDLVMPQRKKYREGDRLPLSYYYLAGMNCGLTVTAIESPVDLFKSQVRASQVYEWFRPYCHTDASADHCTKATGIVS